MLVYMNPALPLWCSNANNLWTVSCWRDYCLQHWKLCQTNTGPLALGLRSLTERWRWELEEAGTRTVGLMVIPPSLVAHVRMADVLSVCFLCAVCVPHDIVPGLSVLVRGHVHVLTGTTSAWRWLMHNNAITGCQSPWWKLHHTGCYCCLCAL